MENKDVVTAIIIVELYEACQHALRVSSATLKDLEAQGELEDSMNYQGEKLLNDKLKKAIELTKVNGYAHTN